MVSRAHVDVHVYPFVLWVFSLNPEDDADASGCPWGEADVAREGVGDFRDRANVGVAALA